MALPLRPSAQKAVLALFDRDLGLTVDQVGGDMPEAVGDLYVEISPGFGGGADQIQGDDVLDVDVYARDYDAGESAALAVEALLLGYPHVIEVDGRKVVIDRVEQNTGPAERPWEDDSVYRIGATYVITARRR